MRAEPGPSSRILQKRPADVLLPQPAVAEIQYGLARLPSSRRKRELERRLVTLLAALARAEWSDAVSRCFGDVKADLERGGEPRRALLTLMATPIEQIPLKTIDGHDSTLGAFAGKVRLVVNVASRCGLTPQYAALEAVYERCRERGFEVLGFPANEFGGQEPGTDTEIKEFCESTYQVS